MSGWTIDKPLTCWRTMPGWFSIFATEPFGQVNGASVEGDRSDMGRLADALEKRERFSATRCSVVVDGEFFYLSSPRNSMSATRVPMTRAAGLVEEIRKALAEPEPPSDDFGEGE